jgi:hypothetical protein
LSSRRLSVYRKRGFSPDTMVYAIAMLCHGILHGIDLPWLYHSDILLSLYLSGSMGRGITCIPLYRECKVGRTPILCSGLFPSFRTGGGKPNSIQAMGRGDFAPQYRDCRKGRTPVSLSRLFPPTRGGPVSLAHAHGARTSQRYIEMPLHATRGRAAPDLDHNTNATATVTMGDCPHRYAATDISFDRSRIHPRDIFRVNDRFQVHGTQTKHHG